jgi:hypothetical protein
MNDDDFEAQLARQPLRLPPVEWRQQILRAARIPRPAPPCREPICWWRQLLWPSPLAWGAVAALWVATVTIHLTTPRPPGVGASAKAASPPQVDMALAEQRAWLDQILQPSPVPAPSPGQLPQPHSERFHHLIVI